MIVNLYSSFESLSGSKTASHNHFEKKKKQRLFPSEILLKLLKWGNKLLKDS